MMSKKRILWLFGHTTLRSWEVPLLISMGYEVYCPKIFDVEFGDRSVSVSFDYDNSLSIPKGVIDRLNRLNFYGGLTSDDLNILNTYFDIAFCMISAEPLKSLIYGFKGAVVMHVFGLAGEANYTTVLSELIGIQGLNQIAKIGKRFWFSQSYNNLDSVETDLLKRRSLYMPIGMSGKINESWVGGERKFLFVSPKIKTNTYYRNVYETFKENFGDIPHIIGGGQLIPVEEDKTVLGFLPKEQYVHNMTHMAAMFYDSQNPRQLHYHPIEAIEYGMPLVFMAGGMLDHLGGKKLPGRCNTVEEARKKLIRLSRGDKILAKKITSSQKILLNQFQDDYCIPFWKEAMNLIEKSCIEETKVAKNVVVVLPAAYTGGVLDYTVRFCMSLLIGAKHYGDDVNITMAYPDEAVFEGNMYIEKLVKNGIHTRAYAAEKLDKKWFKKYAEMKGLSGLTTKQKEFCVLKDGMKDFSEFDFAFIMSDASPKSAPIFLDIPYAVVAHDYIQRYVPNLLPEEAVILKINNQKNADYVLTTSKASYIDALCYAGIEEKKIKLTPYMLELCELDGKQNDKSNSDYFIWSTNLAKHKNHLKALEALSDYYYKGGALECFITGANTKYLDSDFSLEEAPIDTSYALKVREKLENNAALKKHIHIKGELNKKEYLQLLANARFVFHPGYGDNGNGSIFDAASFRVPALASDYPGMRCLGEFISIPIHYMDPYDKDSIANALDDMEKNASKYAQDLPEREELEKADYRKAGLDLYRIVKEVAYI